MTVTVDISYAPSAKTEAHVKSIRARWRGGVTPRVAVVGLGRSGRAAAALARAHGAGVELYDDRPPSDLRASIPSASALSAADLVVLSPGVPRTHAALAAALEQGRVVGEIEMASWFLETSLLGVTGTNGKSTTTALIEHGLKRAGLQVFAGGNLGRPLAAWALEDVRFDCGVVELSSYQLESVVDLRLRAGVWLNLQPDHLDRYPSVAHYAAAKRRIFEIVEPTGVAVANGDDDACRDGAAGSKVHVCWFGRTVDDAGVRIHDDGYADAPDGTRHRVFGPALLGRHNRANAAAAVAVWRHLGLDSAAIEAAVETFPGLAHRLERIPSGDGRCWYNDSKATNVAAAIVALEAIDGPKLLLVGGRRKDESTRPLVEAAERTSVQRVLAFGEGEADWFDAFSGSIEVEAVGTLDDAVARARELDVPNVLLSPAGSSFDRYASFEARGDAFRALVERRR